MENERKSMAISGFVLSSCSVLLFVAGFLCLIGVMLNVWLSLAFGVAACIAAVLGVVFSAISDYQFREKGIGCTFSMAGLIVGTVIVTLVVATITVVILRMTVGI